MNLVDEMAKMRTLVFMAQDIAEENKDAPPSKFEPGYMANLKTITDMLESVSRTAKRAKEIQDGITVKVDINANMLMRYVNEVVFVCITDPAQRRAILDATRAFASRINPVGYEVAKANMLKEHEVSTLVSTGNENTKTFCPKDDLVMVFDQQRNPIPE